MKKILYLLLMVCSFCTCTFSVDDEDETPKKNNTSEDIYDMWLEDTDNQSIHFFYYFISGDYKQFEFIRYNDLNGDFTYLKGEYTFKDGDMIFLDRKQEVSWIKGQGYSRYGDGALKDVTLTCQRYAKSIMVDGKEYVPTTRNMDKYLDILYQCDK